MKKLHGNHVIKLQGYSKPLAFITKGIQKKKNKENEENKFCFKLFLSEDQVHAIILKL